MIINLVYTISRKFGPSLAIYFYDFFFNTPPVINNDNLEKIIILCGEDS